MTSAAEGTTEVLRRALDDNGAQIASLERTHAQVVEASLSSNADDEHDPEGATIAFERAQVDALLREARRSREALEEALAAAGRGEAVRCVECGSAIAPQRLAARPAARTCIDCARAASGRR